MEKLFGFMLAVGLLLAVIFGKSQQAFNAAMQGADTAVTLAIALVGGCALWGGLIRMADGAGLSRVIAKALRPLLRRLFPELPDQHPALQKCATAFSANMLGLGNAATPLSLAAMQSLSKSTPQNSSAVDVFWLISSSALQIIPTTVIAMRQAAGSHHPSLIILPSVLASLGATVLAYVIRPRSSQT